MSSFDEDALRRVLEVEASAVEVQPGALPEIRRRIASRRRLRWSPRGGFMIAFGSALTAAAATVALVAGLGSCVPRDGAVPPPVAQPSDETSPTPAESAAPTSAAPGGVLNAAVPVYYLGFDRGKPRLYREYHTVPVGDGALAAKVRGAVGEMLAGKPYDPDYAGGWPDTATVRAVRIEDGVVVVDLTGAGTNNVGSEVAHQAVQQLVWTANAQVAGSPPVRILLDGERVDELWGHVDVRSDLRRAPAAQTVGLVWVIDPQQGATPSRTVTVKVAGIVFEATMQVRILRGGTVVDDRFVTLDKGQPDQGQASFQITLAPGTYTIEGYELSAADGSVQHLDNHQFTVR